ncbi:MAG: PKD domain-containing protein [Candidatus Dojkabacteria bacterium]|nr:PKD domain-containing protein [Candidatus Dojkabacteria bacterium]MDQ7020505.1 PKD domain-containing protein [Candidatus Dojkabacteria bacterium]
MTINLWANSNDPSQTELSGSNDVLATVASISFIQSPAYSASNFNIEASSSAVDKGTVIASNLYDFNRIERDSNPDIGAYEVSETILELATNFLINNSFTTTVYIGEVVDFTDISSGNVLTWEWDFDNDGVVDSTDQNPTYTYTEAGTFEVKLTITDADGSVTVTRTSAVKVLDPSASIEVFRFRNNDLGGSAHFYVTGTQNRDIVVLRSQSGGIWDGVFTYETVAFYVPMN